MTIEVTTWKTSGGVVRVTSDRELLEFGTEDEMYELISRDADGIGTFISTSVTDGSTI